MLWYIKHLFRVLSTLTEATWYSVSEAERTHSPCSEISCEEGTPHITGTKRSSTPVTDTKEGLETLALDEPKPKNTDSMLVKTPEHKALWENNTVEFQVIPEEEGSNFEKESESSVEKDLESCIEKDSETSEVKGGNCAVDLPQKGGGDVRRNDSNIVASEEIHKDHHSVDADNDYHTWNIMKSLTVLHN